MGLNRVCELQYGGGGGERNVRVKGEGMREPAVGGVGGVGGGGGALNRVREL